MSSRTVPAVDLRMCSGRRVVRQLVADDQDTISLAASEAGGAHPNLVIGLA
jgi:hypothetical protein